MQIICMMHIVIYCTHIDTVIEFSYDQLYHLIFNMSFDFLLTHSLFLCSPYIGEIKGPANNENIIQGDSQL